MKTDQLIAALAADAPAPRVNAERNLLMAAAIGAAAASLLLALVVGVRGDIKLMLGDWRFVAKFVVAGVLVMTMARAALKLSRPDVEPRLALRLLAVPLGLLAVVLGAEALTQPASAWGQRAVGSNGFICLSVVPMLAAVPLIAVLLALRSSAPQSPAILGAVAGALSGGIGAFFYAAHCTDDSPMFVAVWYSLAILAVSLIGMIAGRRVLAW